MRRPWRLTQGLVIGTVVLVATGPSAACASATIGHERAAPRSASTQRVGTTRTITVTAADSGRSLTLHRGERLAVQLTGPTLYTWTEPASSNMAVLQRKSGSSGGQASALFVATRTGRAMVTATDNPNCYPECLPPSRLFQVSLSVTG